MPGNAFGIVVNCWALYVVGGYVEADCGSDRVRDAYIGSAVAGNLLKCLLGGFSAGESGEPSIAHAVPFCEAQAVCCT